MKTIPMQFPYGAVYFRKSNPPREDWERDYAQAAEDGVNIFRHWFMWSAIEIAPGVFDWDDYDRQMDLAAKYNIKTVIAEISHAIPEWLTAKYPELLPVDDRGGRRYPGMGASTVSGGFGSLCLDKSRAREMTANFLENLVRRYASHPALLGYDVENECTYHGLPCYCEDSLRVYRHWLKEKYGDIKTLAGVWRKYSYTSFDEIRQPTSLGFYPESADWLAFCHDNFYERIKWKIDTIRTYDPNGLVAAHGVGSSLRMREKSGCDDWTAAKLVEVYGYTWVPCRHGNEPWRLFSAADQTRAGSRGKTFWHAEAQGGDLWLQPQLKGRPANDARIADEKDVRIWHFMSMASGARGILYPRHRPLLDGPLFGAFGPYAMDGSRTPRSEMGSKIAKWANAPEQKSLISSVSFRAQIGILYMPECGMVSYLHSMAANEDVFFRTVMGAYQGFLDNNIPVDFVQLDNIDEYKALYFAYPVTLTKAQADKLKAWVAAGGVLICEACPAYFGDNFHVGTVQPNHGLDEVFGARQKRVEFMPDINTDLAFDIFGVTVGAEGFLQTYEPSGGTACASYGNEALAVINNWGKGKTLLIGASPSGRYGRIHDAGTREFFGRLPAFAGQQVPVTLGDNSLHVRLSRGEREDYLWLLNTTEKSVFTSVKLNAPWRPGAVLWAGGALVNRRASSLDVSVDSRDALVVTLQREEARG